MLMSTRNSILDVAQQLIIEGDELQEEGKEKEAQEKYKKALKTLQLIENNLGETVARYGITVALSLPDYYGMIADSTNDKALKQKAVKMLEEQIERLMQYVSYNNAMAQQFGPGMSMTTESTYMPYQMQGFIDAYERHGGDPKKVDDILKRNGFTREYFQKLHSAAYSDGENSGVTVESVLEETRGWAAMVYELQNMDEASYAAADIDRKYIDSVFYGYLDEMRRAGITDEEIAQIIRESKVDLNRSRRVYEEYVSNHP